MLNSSVHAVKGKYYTPVEGSMGESGRKPRVTLGDAFSLFDRGTDPCEPWTATEAADALSCSRRTAYNKFTALEERGELRSKKTGARGRVWWRPKGDNT